MIEFPATTNFCAGVVVSIPTFPLGKTVKSDVPVEEFIWNGLLAPVPCTRKLIVDEVLSKIAQGGELQTFYIAKTQPTTSGMDFLVDYANAQAKAQPADNKAKPVPANGQTKPPTPNAKPSTTTGQSKPVTELTPSKKISAQ